MGSDNAYMPATPAQIRYIIQWFTEWGEMQRGDFLPVLLQAFRTKGNINGLVSSLDSCSVEDRPPSIFQCRIKLFKEWSENWNQNEKEQLVSELRSIDQEFFEKFDKQLNATPDTNEEPLTNGNVENVDKS